MGQDIAFGVLLILPILCWALLAPPARRTLTVALVLLGWALLALALHLGAVRLGESAMWDLLYVPLSTALIVTGFWLASQNRSVAIRPARPRKRRLGWLCVWLYATVGGIIVAPVLVVLAMADAGTPELSLVLPLSAGLSVLQETGTSCGSDTCSRALTVSSAAKDSSTASIERAVRQSLDRRGWVLDADGGACRPVGPFGLATQCVSVFQIAGEVQVEVSVSGSWF